MRCGHCKRNDAAIDVIHVRACSLARGFVDPAESLVPAPKPVTEEGFYYTGAEYVKVLRSESSGHLYAKVWEGVTESWDYTAGLLRLMTADMKISAEEAAQFGALYSRCVFCSRKLTDERSIEAGYGPDCAEHHGLPWGDVA